MPATDAANLSRDAITLCLASTQVDVVAREGLQARSQPPALLLCGLRDLCG